MSTSLEAVDGYTRVKAAKQPKKHTYKLLIAAWLFLISCGITGAKLYSDHMKNQIAEQVAAQTQAQLSEVESGYKKQLDELKSSMTDDMTKLQSKVDALNELLAFTKDSANSKTDNSNQLYTQLAEVKKKLDELQRNLDVLK